MILASVASCAHKLPAYPDTKICILDYVRGELRCIKQDKTKFNLSYKQANKFICTSGEDYLEVNAWFNKVAEMIKVGITRF